MTNNYEVNAMMTADGEMVGKPQIKMPHGILEKYWVLSDRYASLKGADPELIDKTLSDLITSKITKYIAKYAPGKREVAIRREMKQWGDALLFLTLDMEEQN